MARTGGKEHSGEIAGMGSEEKIDMQPPPRQRSLPTSPLSRDAPGLTMNQPLINTLTTCPGGSSPAIVRRTSPPTYPQRPTSLHLNVNPPPFPRNASHHSLSSLSPGGSVHSMSPGTSLYNVPSTCSLPMPPPFNYSGPGCDMRKPPAEAEENPDGSLTPAGLSWRRMHLGRAKLKATAATSELLSGFAMVAMVELQINDPTFVPEWLFVVFSICTTVLVSVHIFALMISTYILPNIDAICKLHLPDLVEESPHEKLRWYIELAWMFSNILGLFLFLVELAILCWVKFWDYSFTSAWAAMVVVVPVLIIFVIFSVHFYHKLVVHKFKVYTEDLESIEAMKKKLDSDTDAVHNRTYDAGVNPV